MSLLAFLSPLLGIGIGYDITFLTLIYALKILTGSYRPVHGNGLYSQFLFNLIQKIQSLPGIPVQLIDKCKDRDPPHSADLKKLPCLRLNTL